MPIRVDTGKVIRWHPNGESFKATDGALIIMDMLGTTIAAYNDWAAAAVLTEEQMNEQMKE